MQAKDITIGEQYALKRYGKLIRFRVTATINRKTANHEKATNYVEGYDATTQDEIAGGPLTQPFSVQAAELLGPYDQFTALVTEKERKEAERKARDEAEKRTRIDAVQLLAETVGLPIHDDEKRGREQPPGVETYYNGLKIPDECLPKLVEYLSRHKLKIVA